MLDRRIEMDLTLLLGPGLVKGLAGRFIIRGKHNRLRLTRVQTAKEEIQWHP